MNREPDAEQGGASALRIIAAIVVLVIAGGAALHLVGLLSRDAFQGLALQTLLVGGVAAATALVLGWLGRR